MAGHASLDQSTLLELWNLANECEVATKGHPRAIKNIYIRAITSGEKAHLHVQYERGTGFAQLISWLHRFLNKKSYEIKDGSPVANLLQQLHNKTVDLSEAALIKAIGASSLCKEGGLGAFDVLTKIKKGCRTVNLILQHILEHKLEKTIEPRQESLKLFFSGLFLPSWGLTDARMAEIQRAAEELQRAQAVAANKNVGIVEKIQAYLDAATAQLNVAMTGKEEAEELLSRAKCGHLLEDPNIAAIKASDSSTAADSAASQVNEIVKLADALVKAKEASPSKAILNFGQIEELKKFREIINVVGQVAEYAQAAKKAAYEVSRLALKQ